MAKVNKAVNKGIRILNRTLRTQGSLRKMQNSEDLRVIALGRVLDAALNDLATPDEQASTAPIRSLRRKLEVRKDDLDGVSVGRVAQADSREHMWLMVLFHLLREFKPQNCLELGTCLGISAAYEASALNMNGGGKLVSMEYSMPRVELARMNHEQLGLDNVRIVQGYFNETLPEYLKDAPVLDFAFIDGHHDEEATQEYFKQILPHLSRGAILVFDDILWSPGMERAWDHIRQHPEIGISVDLHTVGICCIGPKPLAGIDNYYKISLG